jgi:class 3 adenylate cyclase
LAQPSVGVPFPRFNAGVERLRLPTELAKKTRVASLKALSEHRTVTVLLAGLTNFMAAFQYLDSEEVYVFTDEAISLLTEVVYKYEGTVDKFTGDGLMVLFGLPTAHENDPERAIRAALEMQTKLAPLLQQFKETCGFDFQLGIGIHTGEVVAGRIGSDFYMEYTVVGDTVARASELQQAAKPGTVLVSTETYQHTRPLFEFEVLPGVPFRGAASPAQAFRPLGFVTRPGRIRGLLEMQAPMIGRDNELNRLKAALDVVRHEQRRRIVLLAGEAGIGKSRLLAEFQSLMAGSGIGIYQGGCPRYARSRPLGIVAEIWRELLGLAATGSSSDQRDKLQHKLDDLGLAGNDIGPYLANVLADAGQWSQLEGLDPDTVQRQTHAALRQVLVAAARLAPMVLIFEDLQWVDQASREFLEYIIQTTGDEPFLLVLVSRQTERDTVTRSLLALAEEESGLLLDLSLSTLTAAESQALVDQLISESEPDLQALKKEIISRGEGNPFYLEEIIRMLIDQGGLTRKPASGDWQITPRAGELLRLVPTTIKDSILARFDRLPERVRQTLQKAAVLGPAFSASLLQKLNDNGLDALAVHLQELEEHQFLQSQSLKPGENYWFRYNLLQETVYSTLLKCDQRQIQMQATWPNWL